MHLLAAPQRSKTRCKTPAGQGAAMVVLGGSTKQLRRDGNSSKAPAWLGVVQLRRRAFLAAVQQGPLGPRRRGGATSKLRWWQRSTAALGAASLLGPHGMLHLLAAIPRQVYGW